MEAKVRTGSGCCHIVGKVKGYLAFTSSCAVCKLLVPVGRGGSKTKPPVGKKHRAALIQSPGRYLLPLCPKPAAQPALQLAEYSSKFLKWDLLFLFWPQCDILYHQKMSGKGQCPRRGESCSVGRQRKQICSPARGPAPQRREALGFMKGGAESWMTARTKETAGEIDYTQRGLLGNSLCFLLSVPYFRASQEIICLAFSNCMAETVCALLVVHSACFAVS